MQSARWEGVCWSVLERECVESCRRVCRRALEMECVGVFSRGSVWECVGVFPGIRDRHIMTGLRCSGAFGWLGQHIAR